MTASDRKREPELAAALQALYAPGVSVYALRQGRIYVPAEHLQTGEKLPLTREAVEEHLANHQPIGVYPITPGTDVCHFGVLDFDDHEGTGGWELVRGKAQQVGKTLKTEGLSFLAFRSGGGKGIHLFMPFDGPVKAAALRAKLRSALGPHKLRSGDGGVEKGEVEIFPKQDLVPAKGLGNLIALPLARRSVLLDEEFKEFAGDVLAHLRTFARIPASRIAEAPPNDSPSAASSQVDVEGELGEPEKHALSRCEFVQHCVKNAKGIREPLWLAAATNAAQARQGRAFFHYLSQRDPERYKPIDTERKFDHARGMQPHSCRRLVDLGYTCPKMDRDGTCTITRGTNPASFAVPASTLVEGLRRIKPVDVRNRRIALVVRTRLLQDGAFFVAGSDQALLYFARAEKRLYEIASSAFAAYLCDHFGLNTAEQEFKFVAADIETHALRHGVEQEFHRVAYYSSTALYVDAGAQQMYQLDGEGITLLANGDDGVLFRDSERIEPYTFDPNAGTGHMRKHLVDHLHTSDMDSKDLYHAYIHALAFERLLPTKPIVLVTGQKGSGKSFAGRALKRAIYGSDADVDIGLTAKERDAVAAVTHNYFLCMDNVDGMVDWLGNLLASVSTGATIRTATLYETNKESKFQPRCFLMVNSRDPASLRRDDIADRLLIFEVERHTAFLPESELLRALAENRTAILSEFFVNLNRIVARLKTGSAPKPSAQRLADFAALAATISDVLDLPGAKRALEKLEDKRNDLVLEGNPLVAALCAYCADPGRPEWIVTGELFTKLAMYLPHTMTPRSFGRHLRNLESNLRPYVTLEFRPGPHNTAEVKITPSASTLARQAELLGQGKQGKEGKNF